jgi:hypothetical protein
MMNLRFSGALLMLAAALMLSGCASTGTKGSGERLDLLTREQILSTGATNLYDVISRLRPRWLNVRGARSFNLETEIVVLQNGMLLGTADALRQLSPELAYEIEWMDGTKASAALPGLMSGRHIEAAIIVRTRSGGGLLGGVNTT